MMKKTDSEFSRFGKTIVFIFIFALLLILGWSVSTLPPYSEQMATLVSGNMGISGVKNPVTAVLLNFRAYDTLLEIGVLLLAAIAVFSISHSSPMVETSSHPSPVAALLLRWLLPLIVLVGAYVLWIGSYAPGGAFQAGAILAGGGILFSSAAARWPPFVTKALPWAMGAGLLTFLVVALSTMIVTGDFLKYPQSWAGALILFIEAAATISIATILTVLFIGRDPGESFNVEDD